jgi:hypothetical protein
MQGVKQTRGRRDTPDTTRANEKEGWERRDLEWCWSQSLFSLLPLFCPSSFCPFACVIYLFRPDYPLSMTKTTKVVLP